MARFMRKGKTRVYWMAALPTSAALLESTGIKLHTDMAEISGFSFSNAPIAVPDMGTAFVSQVSGEDTVEDSEIVFYEDGSADLGWQTPIIKGALGVIVIASRGGTGALGITATGNKVDCWPAEVASVAKVYTAANEAATMRVRITCTAAPTVVTLS